MRWIALALLFAAPSAFAHSLWWVKPTHYADGREIGPSDVVSTLIEWSDGTVFGEVHGTRAVATASSVTMPDPTSTRCYRVRAVVAGETSDPSNVWCKVIRSVPNAPTGLGGN
jgi:hypothetical protein